MSVEVLDPTQDPDYMHGIVEEIWGELTENAFMLVKSMYPRGYRVGQKPETDRLMRFIDIIMKKQQLEGIAAHPDAGADADRAQMELFELDELTKELS